MTNKRIVYRTPEGTVTVISPSPTFLAQFPTEAEGLAAVQAKALPSDALDASIMDVTALPADGDFQEAWEKPGPGPSVSINTPKAKAHARLLISRLVRNEVAFLEERRTQAEIEDDTTLVGQIDTRKTAIQSTIVPQIRDGIIAATNIADLKAVRQAYLNSRPQAVKDELND